MAWRGAARFPKGDVAWYIAINDTETAIVVHSCFKQNTTVWPWNLSSRILDHWIL